MGNAESCCSLSPVGIVVFSKNSRLDVYVGTDNIIIESAERVTGRILIRLNGNPEESPTLAAYINLLGIPDSCLFYTLLNPQQKAYDLGP